MSENPSAMFDVEVIESDMRKVVVISDIHSNLPAFQAVLKDLQFQEYDGIICLGDLVGYYTKPIEVLNLVKELVDYNVMGNHDWAAVDLSNPLYKISRPQAQEALKYTNKILGEEDKKWILSLPLKAVLKTPYGSVTLVHGHPTTLFDYIYGPTKELFEKSIEEALADTSTDWLFVGHSHIQGIHRSHTGKIFVNPGSVGQPRDNDHRAAYAIVDFKSKEVDLRRVPYDVEDVIVDVIQCCLPEELGSRLRFGI